MLSFIIIIHYYANKYSILDISIFIIFIRTWELHIIIIVSAIVVIVYRFDHSVQELLRVVSESVNDSSDITLFTYQSQLLFPITVAYMHETMFAVYYCVKEREKGRQKTKDEKTH